MERRPILGEKVAKGRAEPRAGLKLNRVGADRGLVCGGALAVLGGLPLKP